MIYPTTGEGISDFVGMIASVSFGEAVVLTVMVLKKIACLCFSFPLFLGFLGLGVYLRSSLAPGSVGQASE